MVLYAKHTRTLGECNSLRQISNELQYDPLELYNRIEPIGFRAALIIDAPKEIKVRLIIDKDDEEMYLFLDGRKILSLICHDPNNMTSTEVTLTAGRHMLGISLLSSFVRG